MEEVKLDHFLGNMQVEKWLALVEKQMTATLREMISSALEVLSGDDFDLIRWIQGWPGQVVLTARAIDWTAQAAQAILGKCSLIEVSDGLANFADS